MGICILNQPLVTVHQPLVTVQREKIEFQESFLCFYGILRTDEPWLIAQSLRMDLIGS
jgi:hypothetical protein